MDEKLGFSPSQLVQSGIVQIFCEYNQTMLQRGFKNYFQYYTRKSRRFLHDHGIQDFSKDEICSAVSNNSTTSQWQILSWESGSLREFLTKRFDSSLTSSQVKLERDFIGMNLSRVAGLKIIWTDNLANHLRLSGDDTEVSIFHHASFLDAVKRTDLFPARFAEETLRTLAFLFPQGNLLNSKWFRKQASQSPYLLDITVHNRHLRAEDRQIEKFTF